MYIVTCSFNSCWEHSHTVSVYRNNCREQLKQKDHSVRVVGARLHLPLFAQLLESSVVATAPVEIGVTLLDFGLHTRGSDRACRLSGLVTSVPQLVCECVCERERERETGRGSVCVCGTERECTCACVCNSFDYNAVFFTGAQLVWSCFRCLFVCVIFL